MARWAVRSVIVAVCCVLAESGCAGSDESDDGPAQAKPELFTNFTPHVWSADAGVDLFGRGSELLRAASEDGFYWPKPGVGSSWPAFPEIDDYFPGFTAALPTGRDPFGNYRWDDRREYTKPLVETVFAHLTDYSESEMEVSASVCSYFLHSVPGIDDANPPSMVYRIVLHKPDADAGIGGCSSFRR
ncbi:hypothetical protein ABH922_003093 [Rhodococcus sp. 27YEA15]|uniref:hypothetical protein n=1 Tax=Rhodococcus sp. 27YEA15 TaxID=3156259 RepID=UPI003C7A4191